LHLLQARRGGVEHGLGRGVRKCREPGRCCAAARASGAAMGQRAV